jgi:hypothetical protein
MPNKATFIQSASDYENEQTSTARARTAWHVINWRPIGSERHVYDDANNNDRLVLIQPDKRSEEIREELGWGRGGGRGRGGERERKLYNLFTLIKIKSKLCA